MHLVEDLDGTNIARGFSDRDGIRLTLMAASGFGTEGTFFPAESFTITSVEGIAALRTLCNLLLEDYDEANFVQVSP